MADTCLDQNCNIPLGTRDAIHVPFVVGSPARLSLEEERQLGFERKPGSFVKFTDDKFIEFIPCDKESAHGILNPFLDEISRYDKVIVFLLPGITTPVRHNFDINLQQKQVEKQILEIELKHQKEADPDCADCWMIRNNAIIRM